MASYSNFSISPRYVPSQSQGQNNIHTYPGINNINSNTPSSRSLTIENAYLHSQLITLQRTLTRQSSQLQAQAETQAQTQNRYGQNQNQNHSRITASDLLLNDPESVLRAAIQDIHASIREFADIYAMREWDSDRKDRDKGRGGNSKGSLAYAWSEVPNVLKSGVRGSSQDSPRDRERERGQSLPVIMKHQSSTKRRDSHSSSSFTSRSGSRDSERSSSSRSSASSLLAALLTRDVYLAMWENAFFLADGSNSVRERYRARKSGNGGEDAGRRDARRRSTGSTEDREREGEGGMITRDTVLADTFRDLWDFSPPQAESWRTQYFSIIQQELSTSPPSSLNTNPNISSFSLQPNPSSIQHKISTYATTLVSSFLTGSLSQFMQKLSSRDDIVMRKSLHGIICQAARLFIRLRAQRGGLVVGDERELLRERFWVGSKEMVLDGAESGRVDERRFDGGRVDVVVSPVVWIVEESVEGRARKRVLVKAVVVIGDDF
ncbi:hypothetical protein VTL71DRAFT_7270 [Oculimacula yallundae]|uniref:Uncharacterized protein n=1 Tax=Oculimacula yallundae TaxID=86028 RepID=A0ABR4BX17_9HELO